MNAKSPLGRLRSLIWLLGALISLPWLTGCIETQVEVRIEADGSGTRRVEMAWEEGTLEELHLDESDVRELLGLNPDRGWIVRKESRPTRQGGSQPHVVFERETQVASIDEWPSRASDLNLRAGFSESARLRDQPRVEIGRGPGYGTITYREVLDGHEIRELLDRVAAGHLVERIAELRPGLSEVTRAEVRGLTLGHLNHLTVWVLEDEDVDMALAEFVREISPELTRLIAGRDPVAAEIDSTASMLREIFEHDDDVNEELEREFPGLSLLAFTNLELEVSIPGTIVESNADRIGEGYAAWEGPIWDAINTPREFVVRSRVDD